MNFLSSDKLFLRLAAVTLVVLYLVILAGAVVRATGSGMGCPDWPKCFGYYIPPTNPSQVEFHENHDYKKSQMIIVNDTLWRATSDFNSGTSFDHTKWEKYPVHNYAKFFVQQTWTEYVNRLVGATSGLCMSLLMFLALLRIKKDWKIFAVLVFGMCVLAFVIWLGKVIVDTNLKPFSITFHMMSALALVSVVIFTQTRVRFNGGLMKKLQVTKKEKILLLIALLATLDQIFFGTQVRQQIDAINESMSGLSRELWIDQLEGVYKYHRTMAIGVVLLNVALFYSLFRLKPSGTTKFLTFSLLFLMLAEYGVGVFMHDFSIPAYAQPVHLLLAMILFGIQFALMVRTRSE
ncbi:hypothetical protein BH09BAC5_BH09BAC5_22380 [soil metagenome]